MSETLQKAGNAAKAVGGAAQKVGQTAKGAGGGAKRGISKFAGKIGFPGIGKGPYRQELNALHTKVAAFQPSEEARLLAERLNAALADLDGGTDRRAACDAAEDAARAIRKDIEDLAQKRSDAAKERKAAQPSKADRKAAEKRRTELTERLDTVLDGAGMDLGAIKLPSELSRQAILAQGDLLRRRIGAEDPNAADPGAADSIDTGIDALKRRIQQAGDAHAAGAKLIAGSAARGLSRAEAALRRFDKAVNGTYQGPLRRTVEVLQMNLTAKPADPDVIRNLLTQARAEREKARNDPGFVAGSHQQAVDAANAEEMERRLESMLSPYQDDIDSLRAAEAPGYDAIATGLSRLRGDAGKPIANGGMQQATLDMRAAADDLGDAVKAARAALAADTATNGAAAQQSLARAKTLYAQQHKLHGDAKVLEADWKAVEALIGSAEAIVPATGALPPDLSPADAKLAKGIAEQAADRLGEIRNNLGALISFDREAKELKEEVHARTFFEKLKLHSLSKLEKYDPKGREALQKKFDALLKSMPTTPAKTTTEAFATLRAEAQKAADAMAEVAAYIEDEAEPLLSELELTLARWSYEGEPGAPKACIDALEALKAQIGLRPPVLDAIRAAAGPAKDEMDKVLAMSPGERKKARAADDEAETKARDEDAKRQAVERKALKKLEERYDAVKTAVAEVDGDKNALAAAHRLIEQIKADIKAGAFDGLEAKRGDLAARLNLLLSNPRGEANRRRSELPGTVAELCGAIEAASSSLSGVAQAIQAHADDSDDDDEREACEEVVSLLDRYVELLESEVDDMAAAAKPLMRGDVDEDAGREAREAGLRILRSFRGRLRSQPMSAELLRAPFPEARGALAPVFRSLEKYEFAVMTSI